MEVSIAEEVIEPNVPYGGHVPASSDCGLAYAGTQKSIAARNYDLLLRSLTHYSGSVSFLTPLKGYRRALQLSIRRPDFAARLSCEPWTDRR